MKFSARTLRESWWGGIVRPGSGDRNSGTAPVCMERKVVWRRRSTSRKSAQPSIERREAGMINPLAIAACLALGFGGLAFAFVGGDSRADKRRAAVAKTDAKASVTAGVDRAARKKQIADGVRDSEMKGKRRRVSLATKIEQAGLSITKQQYWIGSVLLGLVCGALTYVQSRSLILAVLVVVTATVGLPQLTLARLRIRRINKFISN